MFDDAVGCLVNRFTVEKRLGRTLSDDEWAQVCIAVDCDSVEDAIIDLVKGTVGGDKNT